MRGLRPTFDEEEVILVGGSRGEAEKEAELDQMAHQEGQELLDGR